ncbi:hypothetical protein JMJ35_003391 [Cladonia borealis]|uniref:Myb-like domain-containing protein n=1 Tax=Cladonia borealis TaxID=184061 RepID=A0AA39R6V9_9LECA|nr:hypothetical protein JMJ35_003391 [Cladonia borealis]
MSRNPQEQQRYHETRRLPKPCEPNGHRFRTDPTCYDSRTAHSDGWRGQRPFDGSLPYGDKDQRQHSGPHTLEPARNYYPRPPPRPPAYESRETGRSEGRSLRNSGEGVKKPTQTPKPYSREDDQAIINYVKEGKNWQQIALKLDHTKQSVKQHWNRRLRFDDRAKGVEYAFTHS